jgi:hypothetical protein
MNRLHEGGPSDDLRGAAFLSGETSTRVYILASAKAEPYRRIRLLSGMREQTEVEWADLQNRWLVGCRVGQFWMMCAIYRTT